MVRMGVMSMKIMVKMAMMEVVRMGVMSMKIMVKMAMMENGEDGGDEYEDNGEDGNDGKW